MKKTLFLLLVAFLVSGVSQAVAYDFGVAVGDKVVWDGNAVNNGGEFAFSVAQSSFGNTGFSWSTFCVETDEFLARAGTQMTVTGISGTNSLGKTLSDEVAWLYWNFSFSDGLLGLQGYNGSASDQQDLQLLIWNQMGQTLPGSVENITTSKFDDWLNQATAAVSGGWVNNGMVQILNLGTKQDVLIVATDAPAPNPVPEPASVMMLGLGLTGLLGTAIRKRFKA